MCISRKFLICVLIFGSTIFGVAFYKAQIVRAALSMTSSAASRNIGSTAGSYQFFVTTTEAMNEGNVFKFIFPDIPPSNGSDYDLSSMAVSATSGIVIYSTEQVMARNLIDGNPSFELSTTAPWDSTGSGGIYSISNTTTKKLGSFAAQLEVGSGSSNVFLMQTLNQVVLNTTHTLSFQARGISGGEKMRYLIEAGDCGGGNLFRYDFVNDEWDCVNPDPDSYTATSTINDVTMTTDFATSSYSFVSHSSQNQLGIRFIMGGAPEYVNQTAIIDAVQLELGSNVNAFDLGIDTPPTAGAGTSAQTAYHFLTQLDNEITNASFESGTSSWEIMQDGSSAIITTSTANFGSGGVSLYFSSGEGNIAQISQEVNGLTVSSSYNVSFYAKGVNGNDVLRVSFVGDDCGEDLQVRYNFVSKNWDCVDSTDLTELLKTTSTYFWDITTNGDFTRFNTNTIPYSTSSTNPFIGFLVGGPAVYNQDHVVIDDVQVAPGTTLGVFADESVVPTGTAFSVAFGSIKNPIIGINNANSQSIDVSAGTPSNSNEPWGVFDGPAKFSASQSYDLERGGGAIVSDSNFQFYPNVYSTGTFADYTVSFTATSSIPSGGKIHVNFGDQGTFNINGVSATSTGSISDSVTTTIASVATSTLYGTNRVIITTGGAATNPGDVINFIVTGIGNPNTKDIYRRLYVFTTDAGGGLIDGDYFGSISNEYGTGQPPPIDSLPIGGTNKLNILVRKQSGGNNVPLTTEERALIKVDGGNLDKGHYLGSRWLDSNSAVTHENLLDGNYMIGAMPFSRGSNSFYDSFLNPNMASVSVYGGQTVTTTLVFGIPDATVVVPVGGGVSSQNAFVRAYSTSFESFSPVYTDITKTTEGFDANGNGYAIIKAKNGTNWSFNLLSGGFGSEENFSSGTTKYWPPSIPSIYLADVGTTTIATSSYIEATNSLTITLKDSATNNTITNACIGVKRTGGGMFMPSQDVVCNQASNTFRVPTGRVTIEVMHQGRGKPTEYPIAITSATTTKTIYLESPSSYITVTVQDNNSEAIQRAPVHAYGSNGKSNGMTNSSGQAILYVPSGTYTVGGFAPGMGELTKETGVVVTNISNPSVSFFVNASSLRTISGQVIQGGTGVEKVKISARRTDQEGTGNMTETDSSGNYTLRVPAGVYSILGWSENTGRLSTQTTDVTSANASGVNWSFNAIGTLRVQLTNASNLDMIKAHAVNSNGVGNGTESWTTVGTTKYTDISLAAGTYKLWVGSSAYADPIIDGRDITITADQTTTENANAQASASLVTLSGIVTTTPSGDPASDVNVWVSKQGGKGFFSTRTDSTGAYSLSVPDGITYMIGVKELGFIASNGDEEVTVSGNTTKNFTLVSASQTITGTVSVSGGDPLVEGWVKATKTIGQYQVWTGATVEANGSYTLTVDSGTWTVYADSPCYNPSTGTSTTAGSSGVDIGLTATPGCTKNVPQMHGVGAATGGQITKDDMILDIPANALGTAQSTVSVQVQDADMAISSPNATPLANSIQSITATDSTGQTVSSLNSNVSISITYSEADLPIGFDEANLQMGYWDTATQKWEAIASSVNSDNNSITAEVSHFTDFGPILPGVPDAPSNVSATSSSATANTISWDSVATADYYVVYATTTNTTTFYATDLVATTTLTSYSHSSLTEGIPYFYEVAGTNDNGEGSNSATVSSTPAGGSVGVTVTESGGSTAVTEGSTTDTYTVVLNAIPSDTVTITLSAGADLSLSASTLTFTTGNWDSAQTVTVTAVDDSTVESSESVSITHTASSNDSSYDGLSISSVTVTVTDNDTAVSSGGGSSIITHEDTNENTTTTTTTTTPVATSTPDATEDTETLVEEITKVVKKMVSKIKYKFSNYLSIGANGNEVSELQKLLTDLGYFKYPTITGYFGNITKQAVQAFQKAKGIMEVGSVDQQTMEALNKANTIQVEEIITETTVSEPDSTVIKVIFKSKLAVGDSGEEVKILQLKLKEMGHLTFHTATGYFGPITKIALQKYQEAKGLVQSGIMDDQTRTSLNGIISVTTPDVQTLVPDTAVKKSGYTFSKYLYIGDSGEEVKQLQLKLKKLGYFTYATATGYFGPITKEAVVKFQKAEKLIPYPGWVGPQTRSALNK